MIVIVLADIECYRENIEDVEGYTFETFQEFFTNNIVTKMRSRGSVQTMTLPEFTTLCNDEEFDIENKWVGYVYINNY